MSNYNEYFYFYFYYILLLYTVFVILTFYFNLFLYIIIYLSLRQYNDNTKDLSIHIIYCTIVDELTDFTF